ncbi:NtaA/DmoA family FMN-dependent monooxygenase [Streptomyces sp. NPDC006872]|uniref:NtaA/DmoA family FMN-dependent monooxygenase n=1 Tax=Streptomyces sp. NPDC006872 TaxID=3155720 RepID=UPI0033E30562
MSHTPFHLGFFASFGPPSWQAVDDRLNGDGWWTGDFYDDLARRLEEAKVEYLFFEDNSAVSNAVGGVMDADLRFTIYSPKHDPVALLSRLSGSTERIGLIATASTTFYPPFILARQFSTIDSLSGGRAGWNIVTSTETAAAQNFGMDDMPAHGLRYEMADEFVGVAKKLWAAWEPDALVRDVEANTYVDPSKVNPIDHKGTHYSVRGPLNTLPSPQGRPLLVQAGSSDSGRDFAAKHADLVFQTAELGVAGMKAFREDIRARAEKFGRDPDEIKVTFAAFVNFAPDGQEDWTPPSLTDAQLDYALAFWSTMVNFDLSTFPLDEPFPADLEPTGHTGMFMELQELGKRGVPLGEAIGSLYAGKGTDFNGTPEQIAEKMIAAMDEIGGDGLMIVGSKLSTAAFLENVTDKLIPELQRRGAIRSEYAPGTLRERLLAS